MPNDFDVTPSMPLFLEYETEDEVAGMCTRLSDRGEVPMSVDKQGFRRRFARAEDRFGVQTIDWRDRSHPVKYSGWPA